MYIYLITFSLSFFTVYYLTPQIIKLSNKKKILDKPDFRKKHISPISRMGGIALVSSIVISFLFVLSLNINQLTYLNKTYLLIKLICFSSIFLLGFFDDLKPISPFLRLSLQFLIASISWIGIVRIDGFFFGSQLINGFLTIDSKLLSYICTVIWTVGVINAINWIDGLDGLLVGLTLIYSSTFSVISLLNNNTLEALISLIVFFSCLGFLKYNRSPAKIMMGDGGAYLIGLYLSNSALTCSQIPGVINPLIIISLLFVPIIDMVRVISLRIIRGKSPFYPDRKHIHFLLIDNGLSLKNCLSIIFSFTMIFSIINICINI
jgi:UDP-GlcNAc:undecaprenyl-phosphate GlcNAc-1-phosphate transferase